MNERCDCCNARAVHIYRKPVAEPELMVLVLAFCGHHSSQYAPALDAQGWTVEILLEGASQ